MDLGSLLLGLALFVVVAFIVALPLIERTGVREKEITPADRLIAEREVVLAALRDLDFDHATGKITDDDYVPQRAQLVAQGVAMLKQLDALGVNEVGQAEEAIERAVAARRRPSSGRHVDERIEAEVAARRRARAASESKCPRCGRPFQPGDHFCAKCGAKLPQAEAAG